MHLRVNQRDQVPRDKLIPETRKDCAKSTPLNRFGTLKLNLSHFLKDNITPARKIAKRTKKLREKYARGQQRLYDLEGMLPDGFTDKLRELKKEIDIKERRAKSVLDLTKLRLTAAEVASNYKRVFKDITDASQLTREQIQEYFKTINLELSRVKTQSGKRQHSAINRLLIHTYMGKDTTSGVVGYSVRRRWYLEWKNY